MTPDQPTSDSGITAEVYDELRRVAALYFRGERHDHTLQPTALVHEAFVKLADHEGATWNDETHFRAVAARAMRQVLIDHARGRKADKRGGGWMRVTMSAAPGREDLDVVDLMALEDALQSLSEMDERKSRVVELRFFGGLTCAQAADVLGIAPKTAEADWYMARAWLKKKLDA